jgi:hypothetical protein
VYGDRHKNATFVKGINKFGASEMFVKLFTLTVKTNEPLS